MKMVNLSRNAYIQNIILEKMYTYLGKNSKLHTSYNHESYQKLNTKFNKKKLLIQFFSLFHFTNLN